MTYRCEQCSELLWDQLYGLLDAGQEEALRDHLAGCPACQAARARVEAKQQLVARAARLYDTVAPFTVPADEPATAPAPEPATLPLPARPVRARRRWPWVAAAAALLLLVGGGYGVYQSELGRRQADVQQASRSVKDVDRQMADAARAAEQEAATLPRSLAARQIHLSVLGPAAYQPDAANQYRVTTKDLNGKAATVPVTARLVAAPADKPGAAKVLAEQRLLSRGEQPFALPPGLKIPAGAVVRLEVEARAAGSPARVQDRLSVAAPSYLTYLNLDKAIYHPGEIVFFRTLTVDRFSSRPPAERLTTVATVIDAAGLRRLSHPEPLGEGGIGAGQFALTRELCEGECVLEVSEAQGRFPTVRRTFRLDYGQTVPLEADVKFDRRAYAPGDNVRANFQARRADNGAAVANRPVDVSVQVGSQKLALRKPAPPTNARGETAIEFQLPPRLTSNRGKVVVQVRDGAYAHTYEKQLPIVASAAAPVAGLQVEFFPEGGDLVAGLPARVYFRVRQDGRPADLTGTVATRSGQAVVPVRTENQQGLGLFSFTPKAGEAYSLRIDSPRGTTTQPSLPTAQPTGVVLSVPDGVSREGQPLRVRVYQAGAARPLIVAAACRDRLVDQKAVVVGPQGTAVDLVPPPDGSGVLRVTAYQPARGRLVPLAERLVYRVPARRLDVALDGLKPRYNPGERVTLQAKTTAENGRPETSWLLAAVVDERALEDGPRPAPFYLSGEVSRAPDLEQAGVWVRNDPRAFAALDRFLATQGWRRFPRPEPPTVLVQNRGREESRTDATAAASPALVQLDNGTEARAQYARALRAAREQVLARATERREELESDRTRRLDEWRQVEAALADFRDLPGTVLRWGWVGLLLVLFGIGCLALLFALYRLVRGAAGNTRYFGVAFASLLLCLLGVYAGRPGETRERGLRTSDLSDLAVGPGPLTLPHVAAAPRLDQVVPEGLYAAQSRTPVEANGRRGLAVNRSFRDRQWERAAAPNAARRKADEKQKDANGLKETRSGALRSRFAMLQRAQQEETMRANADKGPPVRPVAPTARAPAAMLGGAGGAKGTALKKAAVGHEGKNESKAPARGTGVPVEYAHVNLRAQGLPGPDAQETVLWAPLLKAAGGVARTVFDLSDNVTTYRVLILGNSPDGRLGLAEGRLVVQPAGAPTSGAAKVK